MNAKLDPVRTAIKARIASIKADHVIVVLTALHVAVAVWALLSRRG